MCESARGYFRNVTPLPRRPERFLMVDKIPRVAVVDNYSGEAAQVGVYITPTSQALSDYTCRTPLNWKV